MYSLFFSETRIENDTQTSIRWMNVKNNYHTHLMAYIIWLWKLKQGKRRSIRCFVWCILALEGEWNSTWSNVYPIMTIKYKHIKCLILSKWRLSFPCLSKKYALLSEVVNHFCLSILGKRNSLQTCQKRWARKMRGWWEKPLTLYGVNSGLCVKVWTTLSIDMWPS